MKILNLMDYKNVCGIYGIKCLPESKMYIGASVNIKQRLTSHKSDLKRKVHHSIDLQQDWELHVPEDFIFIIFEIIDKNTADFEKKLHTREKYYIEKHNVRDDYYGYNTYEGGEGGLLSEATKQKIRDNHNAVYGKPILQIDFEGNIIKEWASARTCSKELNILQSCMWKCLNNSRKTYKNCIWIYKNDLESFNLQNYINNKMQIRRIGQYSLEGSLVKIWTKVRDVIKFGFDDSAVIKCCKNKVGNKTHKGFAWKFIEEPHLEQNMISYEYNTVQRHYSI